MSSEIRRLETTYTTKDPAQQRDDGLHVKQRMTPDQISADLADTLNTALDQWYAAYGHRYLETKPEPFG